MTATIASLHCYPLKSGRGVDLSEAQLTRAGIAQDRRWMVVTPEGRFLTQRELPRLALVRPSLTASELSLVAPALPPLRLPLELPQQRVPVQIWKDECPALDEGDDAARWLQQVLQRDCRLVRFDPQHRRLSSRSWTGDLEAENRFSDGFPLLVIGRASLDELNSRLAVPLPMNRFRPNIVLDGIGPYEEDRIDELYCDGVRLRIVKPCTRCRITTTDQDTGLPDGEEPLRTLKSYRFDRELRGVLFGQNTVIVQGVNALLRCGQSLQVRWRDRQPVALS
ncbi:MAG TPA: MOSC N-terminal beta barrel domain-containing protein [Steroidobacteraceae bacterium]|nr:MOSC N-terminal beta barrel domain-containing protein [Steroidobacteraceae bacterium]